MSTLSIPRQGAQIEREYEGLLQGSAEHIKAYFEDSGPDYAAWSANYNMHFGYWNWRTSFFDREKMLEQMNIQVMKRLEIPSGANWHIADLGCGLGATAAKIGLSYPNSHLTGLSIVPSQIEMGNALLNARKVQNAVLKKGDFADPEFAKESMDAVYGVESICYGDGLDKADVIAGMANVLKPGGRFVVTDGFIKKVPARFGPLFRPIYESVCKNWALKDFAHIEHFRKALREHGLIIEKVEDASWRVAPTALQVPFVILHFMHQKLEQGDRLSTMRWGHLKACFNGMLMGMFRSHFGYYIISGRKG